MKKKGSYDQLAGNYDRFVNWNNRLTFELPFITKQLETIEMEQGQQLRALDAACGTGMHAVALAKQGIDVSGADLSEEMVAAAKLNAEKENQRIQFEAVGFGALSGMFGRNKFDALLCLGNSLPHLLTQIELESALKDFANCLRPGGLLLIQNRNFDALMKNHERWMEPQSFVDGEEEWVFQRFYNYEPSGLIQFNFVTLHRSGSAAWSSDITSTYLYPQTAAELKAALSRSGFSKIQFYGSLGGEPFNPDSSGNFVLTANKA